MAAKSEKMGRGLLRQATLVDHPSGSSVYDGIENIRITPEIADWCSQRDLAMMTIGKGGYGTVSELRCVSSGDQKILKLEQAMITYPHLSEHSDDRSDNEVKLTRDEVIYGFELMNFCRNVLTTWYFERLFKCKQTGLSLNLQSNYELSWTYTCERMKGGDYLYTSIIATPRKGQHITEASAKMFEIKYKAQNMTKVSGMTLATIRLGQGVAGNLMIMHENGWFHRDLKPANVMGFEKKKEDTPLDSPNDGIVGLGIDKAGVDVHPEDPIVGKLIDFGNTRKLKKNAPYWHFCEQRLRDIYIKKLCEGECEPAGDDGTPRYWGAEGFVPLGSRFGNVKLAKFYQWADVHAFAMTMICHLVQTAALALDDLHLTYGRMTLFSVKNKRSVQPARHKETWHYDSDSEGEQELIEGVVNKNVGRVDEEIFLLGAKVKKVRKLLSARALYENSFCEGLDHWVEDTGLQAGTELDCELVVGNSKRTVQAKLMFKRNRWVLEFDTDIRNSKNSVDGKIYAFAVERPQFEDWEPTLIENIRAQGEDSMVREMFDSIVDTYDLDNYHFDLL